MYHRAGKTTRAGVPSRNPRRRARYMVEFAFVAIIFFMFLFGVLEYGRLIMTREVMTNAAREGARFAVVNTNTKTTLDVQNQVDSYLAGLGLQLQNYNKTTSIQVYTADPVTGGPVDATGAPVSDWTKAPFTNAQFGQPIAVQVSGTYTPILPALLFMGKSLPLRGRYVMYSEAN